MQTTGGVLEHTSNQKAVTAQHIIIAVIVRPITILAIAQHTPTHLLGTQNMCVLEGMQMDTAMDTPIRLSLDTVAPTPVALAQDTLVALVQDKVVTRAIHNT